MPPQAYTSSTRLRIGVLLAPPPVQLLDLAPIDAFYMLSKAYIQPLELLPRPVKNLALNEVSISYIAAETPADNPKPPTSTNTSGANTVQLAPLTAHLNIQITRPLTSTEIQPGKLDILFIPGPDPAVSTPEIYRSFIKAHARCGSTDIITVCTGIYPACYAGICDGYTVTGPRGLLSDLRKKFPNVKDFEDARWTRSVLDGEKNKKKDIRPEIGGGSVGNGGERSAELWVAGGITNGHDCIAAYIKAHFNTELADIVCRMCDIGDRQRTYDNGQASETVWWVSRILRAVVKGFFRTG